MSTSSTPINPSNKTKVNISMMLNLPIEIELEVVGTPPNQDEQIEEREKVSLTENSECQVIVSGMNLANIEDSQTLLNQIVSQLQQENKVFSTRSQVNLEENNTRNEVEGSAHKHESADNLSYSKNLAAIGEVPLALRDATQTPLPQKKFQLRLSESLNDTMTFALNSVGAILFLGKLANYSWE
ncbi:hypothetical protein [Scytonema sp. NUACC26]|uniref:hypothetical protein n=1 Tax=Scytonema sp. NUACC26 TaxID=3140176 RepID=UPI0034DB841A